MVSRYRSLYIGTRLQAGQVRNRVSIPLGTKIYHFSKLSRPTPQPAEVSFQRESGLFPPVTSWVLTLNYSPS